MTMRRPLFLACGLVLVASPLSAQRSERIASGVLFEHYGFEDGFIARETTQWLVPIATTVRFGSRASLALATGFTAVELATADSAGFGSRRITGPIDTDARLSVHLVPDRIIAIATAVLPTGQQTLLEDELLLPALLANDAIGYSAVSLGSGGSLGVGLSAAIPVGRRRAVGRRSA